MSNSLEVCLDTCVLLCLHRNKKFVSHDVSFIICFYLCCNVDFMNIWIVCHTERFEYCVRRVWCSCMVCTMQNEYYFVCDAMIILCHDSDGEYEMNYECDFVHHSNMHSFITLFLFDCMCVVSFSVASLCVFLYWYLFWNASQSFFIMWGLQQWWRFMSIINLCSSRKLIILWVYSLDDVIISIKDADEDYTVCLQLQAIWGGKHCLGYMLIMNRTWYNHCIIASMQFGTHWDYGHISIHIINHVLWSACQSIIAF